MTLVNFDLLPSYFRGEVHFYDYVIPLFFVLVFIGSIPSKISALKIFTNLSCAINLIMTFIIIYYQPQYHKYNKEERSAEFHNFQLNLLLSNSYCLSLFSVVNQFAIINILSEFKGACYTRVKKVFIK